MSQAQSTTLSSLRADSLIGGNYGTFGKLKQRAAKQNDNVLKTPSKHERAKNIRTFRLFLKPRSLTCPPRLSIGVALRT
jgi:hypothetical protein